MTEMKTLTLPNGKTYEIVDEYAREQIEQINKEIDYDTIVDGVLEALPTWTGGKY